MSLNVKSSSSQEAEVCSGIAYQRASVCVPVTITPFANPGNTTTLCCGTPVVSAGAENCTGTVNGNCSFTISQDICVAVPVEFGATSTVSDILVNCGDPSATDICTDCVAAAPSPLPVKEEIIDVNDEI